jgi:alkanesulfonate monooxygenase SsuD/methylene tetrahydromethanopterin reductase-like flavin-dependent oxidoreductase (luciferase family)
MDETPSQPPEPSKPDALVAAVRKLTVAVWAVAVAFFLVVCLYALSYFQMTRRFMQAAHSSAAASPAEPTSRVTSFSMVRPDTFEGKKFGDLPVEKKITYASVIVLTRHERRAQQNRELITEIVKLKPGTELHYKVGDELGELSKEGDVASSGNGNIVFMTGSPAKAAEAMPYDVARLQAVGGLRISDLRDQVKREGK